jgi:hypothetical protein
MSKTSDVVGIGELITERLRSLLVTLEVTTSPQLEMTSV